MPSKEEIKKENETLRSKLLLEKQKEAEIKKEYDRLLANLEFEKQKGIDLSNSIKLLIKSIMDTGIAFEYITDIEDLLNAKANEKEEHFLVTKLSAKIDNLKESNIEEHSAPSQLTRIKLDSNPLPSVTTHSILKSSKRKKIEDQSSNQQALEHEESFSVVSSKKR